MRHSRLFLPALAALLPLLAVGAAAADTPTPTAAPAPSATPEPTPTPTPTPYAGPTSTITIRFVSGGQPVSITIANGTFSKVLADGADCADDIQLPIFRPMQSSGIVVSWPRKSLFVPLSQCSKGPPTALRFEFFELNTRTILFTEFVWTASDMTVDIEVPPSALPQTGGPPGDVDSSPAGPLVAVLAGIIMAAVAATARLHGRQ